MATTIYVTGLYASGKTTFAVKAETDPKKVGMMDFDLKFRDIAESIGIHYASPNEVQQDNFLGGTDQIALAKWMQARLPEIISRGITTLIFDNVTPMEAVLGAIVRLSPEKYGVNAKHAASGNYGGVNPGIFNLWRSIIQYASSHGVERVITISHLSTEWVNNAPIPNKFHGRGNKVLFEVASLGLVLMQPGDEPPTPAAFVIKEQLAFGKRVLPSRMPVASWEAIRAYMANPYDPKNPKPGETPTEEEIEKYGAGYSKKQLDLMAILAQSGGISEGPAEPVEPFDLETFKSGMDLILKSEGLEGMTRMVNTQAKNIPVEHRQAVKDHYADLRKQFEVKNDDPGA